MPLPRRPFPQPRAPRPRLALLLLALLLPASPRAQAGEDPAGAVEEILAFTAAGAAGTLVLPAGAPDRRSPAVIILPDRDGPDGRASGYTDQFLGAGLAVLEVVHLPGDSLEAVLAGLALHPRVLGERLGLLGFGSGARLAVVAPSGVMALALLYPGCAGLEPAAMPGAAVLLMHGTADPVHPPAACAALGAALRRAGATLRHRPLAQAGYAWDRPAFAGEGLALLPAPEGEGRVAARAWPDMAALSAAEVAGFFAGSLLAPRP